MHLDSPLFTNLINKDTSGSDKLFDGCVFQVGRQLDNHSLAGDKIDSLKKRN